MGLALYRLVYRSVFALHGDGRAAAHALVAILDASRRRNAALGLTGALLHSGAQFVQVIEGPLPAVEAVFDRIAADLRHTAVELLQFAPVQHASFPAWSMAYVPPRWIEGLPDFAPLCADGGPEAIEGALATISGALRRGTLGPYG